jgi:thioredoxin-dependent peroxiredoxin
MAKKSGSVKKAAKRTKTFTRPVKTVKSTIPKQKMLATKESPSQFAMPKPGELAPDFSLPDGDGHLVNLRNLRGSPVVIYFYPKDDTPGCTLEAIGFRDDYAAFKKKRILVFGISKDDAKSHQQFRKKYQLTFPLLSDLTGDVVKRYGCWVEKSLYGKKYMGIQRATFVIDANGYVMKVFPKVTPEGHSKEILKLFG